jgi:uncharacterized protein (TIGR03083 family)
MTSEATDSPAPGQALRQATARTTGLLRGVRQPDAAAAGLTWTVSETAAHLVAEITDYAAFARGEQDAGPRLAPGDAETPTQRQAAANTAQLARFTERDLTRLADSLAPAVEDFIAAAAQRRPDERVPTSNGRSMTPPTMAAALLGELLIHGLDIARAAGTPWEISRADALEVVAGVMALVPDYIDRQRAAGLHVSYELRFRGGPSYRIGVDDGAATITAPGPKVDCWISADPVAFLLVGYGRAGQWSQILRGKLLGGGRKPWLAPAFGGLITGP